MAMNGHLTQDGKCDQTFQMGDIENDTMMTKTVAKQLPLEGAFSMDNWTQLYGGTEATKPLVERFITYARNNNDTTTNEYYPFNQEGHNVTASWQVLKWRMDELNAVRISHIGVLSHNNAKTLRLVKTGRSKYVDYNIDPWTNQLPMPLGTSINDEIFNGPAKLGRGFWVWNEDASIEVKDSGTTIPGWSASNKGVMVGVWGNKIQLNKGD